MSKKIKMSMEDIEAMIQQKVDAKLAAMQEQEEDVIEIEVEDKAEEVEVKEEETVKEVATPEAEPNAEIEALKAELAKAKKEVQDYKKLFETRKDTNKPELAKFEGWGKKR